MALVHEQSGAARDGVKWGEDGELGWVIKVDGKRGIYQTQKMEK